MFEQRQNAIADQVRSSEVARYEQQVAGNHDLALGQPILRLLGRDERANKVGAAPIASLIYRTGEIIIEALPRRRQLCCLLGRPSHVEDLRPCTFDVIAEYAAPLPIIVIAEMLGVAARDLAQFKRWSDASPDR
jgi:hypothetical protein